MAGVVSFLVGLVPEAAVAPILVFVGLEITAQAFLATPSRHAPAVALAFIPTIAALVLIVLGSILASLGLGPGAIRGEAASTIVTLRLLGNGFILSALLWGAAAALIIDRRLLAAAATLGVASRGEPVRRDPLAPRVGRPLLARAARRRRGRGSWPAATASWRDCSCCSRPGRARTRSSDALDKGVRA